MSRIRHSEHNVERSGKMSAMSSINRVTIQLERMSGRDFMLAWSMSALYEMAVSVSWLPEKNIILWFGLTVGVKE